MRKTLLIATIFCLFLSARAFSQEEIVNYEDDSLPVLNQELRHSRERLSALENVTTSVDLTSEVEGILPLDNGGTGAALVDQDDDMILFWDDSNTTTDFLDVGSGLTITGTTMTATATSYGYWGLEQSGTLSSAGSLAINSIGGVAGDVWKFSIAITSTTGTTNARYNFRVNGIVAGSYNTTWDGFKYENGNRTSYQSEAVSGSSTPLFMFEGATLVLAGASARSINSDVILRVGSEGMMIDCDSYYQDGATITSRQQITTHLAGTPLTTLTDFDILDITGGTTKLVGIWALYKWTQ